jgi:hypothetical protein
LSGEAGRGGAGARRARGAGRALSVDATPRRGARHGTHAPPPPHPAPRPRSYVKSRSDVQLAGQKTTVSSLTACEPLLHLNGNPSPADIINPCGLVAWSNFNDTYEVGRLGGGAGRRAASRGDEGMRAGCARRAF